MCVAIYKPAGTHLPQNVLEACFRQNDDGGGFAVRLVGPGGKPIVHVEKGFFTFAAFWAAWKEYGNAYQAVIHFRIMTHGKIAEENCHPFLVEASNGRTLAVAHNGVLSDFTRLSSEARSDSRAFVETAIGPLYKKFPNLLKSSPMLPLLERGVGYFNKVVMMENDGTVQILNKLSGYECAFSGERDPVWFSNQSWKPALNWFKGSETKKPESTQTSGPSCAYTEGADLDDDAYEAWAMGAMRWSDPKIAKALEDAKAEVEVVAAEGKKSTALVLVPPPASLKLKYTVPRGEIGRVADRRDLKDRTYWADGYEDAYAGVPYTLSSGEAAYHRGFEAAIEELMGDETRDGDPHFSTGYHDRVRGQKRRVYASTALQRRYNAGFEWAEYERLNAAEDLHDDAGRGDVRSDTPGDTGAGVLVSPVDGGGAVQSDDGQPVGPSGPSADVGLGLSLVQQAVTAASRLRN